MSRPRAALRAGAAGILAMLVVAVAGHADVIILTDGHAIHGHRQKEQTLLQDPATGEAFLVSRANGLSSVDDGARYVVFPPTAKRVGDVVDETDIYANMITYEAKNPQIGRDKFPTIITLNRVTEWDAKWERTMVFNDIPAGPKVVRNVRQKIAKLTPHYVRMQGLEYRWECCYLTKELEPALLRRCSRTTRSSRKSRASRTPTGGRSSSASGSRPTGSTRPTRNSRP